VLVERGVADLKACLVLPSGGAAVSGTAAVSLLSITPAGSVTQVANRIYLIKRRAECKQTDLTKVTALVNFLHKHETKQSDRKVA
jgi:hypothetical protein